jgi:hypothetical protein
MTREDAVQSLARFDTPLNLLRDYLAPFSFDWPGAPLAILRREHLLAVLDRWQRGELSGEDVEEWANLVEVRDDLDHDRADSAVGRAVFDLANPDIQGRLDEIGPQLINTLKG